MWYQPEIKHRRSRIFINVTSLVDVLFLLLIFFALSSSFNSLGALDVNLPWAQTVAPAETVKSHEIMMYRDGRLALDGRKMSLDALVEEVARWSLKEKFDPVFLKADKSISYGKVISLLDQLRGKGVLKIQALTQNETTSHEN